MLATGCKYLSGYGPYGSPKQPQHGTCTFESTTGLLWCTGLPSAARVSISFTRVHAEQVLPVDFLPEELLDRGGSQDKDDGSEVAQDVDHMDMELLHQHGESTLQLRQSAAAVHDEDHPHHERHKQLAKDGYSISENIVESDPQRKDSVRAFFDSFPEFETNLVPLKVRRDPTKFSEENGACAYAADGAAVCGRSVFANAFTCTSFAFCSRGSKASLDISHATG